MNKKRLLMAEIHLGNFLFVFVLSFFYEVKAYSVQSRLFSLISARVAILDLAQYFDYSDCILINDEAAEYWAKNIQPFFPSSDWKLKIDQTELDMAQKAMQTLQQQFVEMLFLQRVFQKDIQKQIDVAVIFSMAQRYIRKVDRGGIFPESHDIHLARVHLFLDWVNQFFKCAMSVGRVILEILYGMTRKVFQRQGHRMNPEKVNFIWDGLSTKDLALGVEQNTFSWIVDDQVIHKEEILFILPRADFQRKEFSKDEAINKGYHVCNLFEISSIVPFRLLLNSLFEVIGHFLGNLILLRLSFADLLNLEHAMMVFRWKPISQHLEPKAYVTAINMIGNENPAIVYFNKQGIKTVMWAYGINCCLFLNRDDICQFRNIVWSNILSSDFIIWNEHFKEFIERHPQNAIREIILGPLMSGCESVFDCSKEELVKKSGMNKAIIKLEGKKIISFFDVPPVDNLYKPTKAHFPDSNTEEYNYAFIRDIYKLLDHFDNLVLVYKPKRSIVSGKFRYSERLKDLLAQMNKDERVIIMDYNINPWLPIALADVTVSMPFESPFFAGLQYKRPAIFHDPLNIALNHRYGAISEFITHRYEELESMVSKCLEEGNRVLSGQNSRWDTFMGNSLGTSATDQFRRYLRGFSKFNSEIEGKENAQYTLSNN